MIDVHYWPTPNGWKITIGLEENQGQDLDEFPNLKCWFETLRARPAVQRGFEVGSELRAATGPDEKAKQILFGQPARR